MSDTSTPGPDFTFEDPATCPHPLWIPYRKRVTVYEPIIGVLTTTCVWCPRCDQKRMGPVEEGV